MKSTNPPVAIRLELVGLDEPRASSGELLGLSWGDIDWQTRQVYVRQQYTGGAILGA